MFEGWGKGEKRQPRRVGESMGHPWDDTGDEYDREDEDDDDDDAHEINDYYVMWALDTVHSHWWPISGQPVNGRSIKHMRVCVMDS